MLRFLLAALVLSLATPAGAADENWTPGVGITNAKGEVRCDDGVSQDSLEFEWVVGVAAAAMPQYLDGAKFLYCDNRSSANVYLTLDAVNLTSTGSTGYKLAPGTDKGWPIAASTFWSRIKAVATAATTSGAALWCAWLK